jgi:DNA invertase Pin-like site-specific DNA recombinase
MIGAINEFERTNLLERQREGIALAVKEGKYKGRKEVKIENFPAYYARYKQREFTKAQLATELNISRPTLDKLIMEHEQAAAV